MTDFGTKEIKYIEWNLNARGGINYEIPMFITKYLKEADLFVLVEFCASKGWDRFKDEMKEYDLYCSPYTSVGYNQVCIGIRRDIKYKLISVVTKDICDINIPEFLQINIMMDNKELSIIGTRIKTQSDTKDKQINYLKNYFKNVQRFICLGDFNADYSNLSDKLLPVSDVYGPRVYQGYYSYVHRRGGTSGLDWIVSKNIGAIYNGYIDAEKSPYSTYDWGFVIEENGYGSKKEDDYLNIHGLPDHAILKGMFKI